MAAGLRETGGRNAAHPFQRDDEVKKYHRQRIRKRTATSGTGRARTAARNGGGGILGKRGSSSNGAAEGRDSEPEGGERTQCPIGDETGRRNDAAVSGRFRIIVEGGKGGIRGNGGGGRG